MNPAYKILDRLLGSDIYIISPTWQLDSTMKTLIKYLIEKKEFSTENCFDDVHLGM